MKTASDSSAISGCASKSWLWALWGLLVARMLFNDFALELSRDEGLWLWNSRCDHWGLPTHGILHQVLSPATYVAFRCLWWVAEPSVVVARCFHSLLIAAGMALVIRYWLKQGRAMAAWVVVGLFALDPLGFKLWSWALIEAPAILVLIVAWIAFQNQGRAWAAPLLGLAIGVAIAVKLSSLWVLALACPTALNRQAIREMVISLLCAGVVIGAFYGGVWSSVDHDRGVFVWRYHTQGRLAPLKGLGVALATHDSRFFFHWLLAVLYPVAAWWHWRAGAWSRMRSICALAIVGGTLQVMVQGYLPPHYITPLSAFVILELGAFAAASRTAWRWLPVVSSMAIIIVVNAGMIWSFVFHPGNAGGKYMQQVVAKTVLNGAGRVAAPVALAVQVRADIVPASSGLLVTDLPDMDREPDLLVLAKLAVGPSANDEHWKERIDKRHIQPAWENASFVVYSLSDRVPALLPPDRSQWLWCR